MRLAPGRRSGHTGFTAVSTGKLDERCSPRKCRASASVPEAFQTYRTKPDIAIEEIDRVIAAGVRLGCVLDDAGSSIPPQVGVSLRGSPEGWRHMALTDAAIRNAKPGEKAVKLSDGAGMFMLVHRRGKALAPQVQNRRARKVAGRGSLS